VFLGPKIAESSRGRCFPSHYNRESPFGEVVNGASE
jgi:hypothetical protein